RGSSPSAHLVIFPLRGPLHERTPVSYQDLPASAHPDCKDCATTPSIELLIEPRERDIGGLIVRRVLPAARRQMLGPFVFFDHMGPAVFAPGEGMDVRPHPHINLATVTYLFEGEIDHRDSLGSHQI